MPQVQQRPLLPREEIFGRFLGSEDLPWSLSRQLHAAGEKNINDMTFFSSFSFDSHLNKDPVKEGHDALGDGGGNRHGDCYVGEMICN